MTFTDEGTKIKEFIPQSFANGLEWGHRRKGFKDRYNCLYRKGFINKVLWYIGAFSSSFLSMEFITND
jgi:hypothetical protein